MKKLNFAVFVLLLFGMISCSTVKQNSSSRTKTVIDSSTPSDKTVINYSRTLSAKQADQVVQLLKTQLKGFPDDSLPISFVNNTQHSYLNLHLKKKKIKFSFRSKLNLDQGNQEVMTMHRLKEQIASL